MVRVSYHEGDWFAVPLREGGFGVGLVARANPGGVLLGYFFGPKRAGVPVLGELTGLKVTDAVLVRKFGHLGLVQGKWPIVGHFDCWNRRGWPRPVFISSQEVTGRGFSVFFE